MLDEFSPAGSVSVEQDVTASREQRARRLQAVYALRCWMQKYPELFGTQVQLDCFIIIGLLTTHSRVIPSLNSLYHRLTYAENSVRGHLRALASGGWISFVRGPGGDRRAIGVRIEPPIIRVYDEYFGLLDAIGLRAPAARPDEPGASVPDTGTPSAMGGWERVTA